MQTFDLRLPETRSTARHSPGRCGSSRAGW